MKFNPSKEALRIGTLLIRQKGRLAKPELTRVSIRWKMPLNIRWQIPVEIHWESGNPLGNATEHVNIHWKVTILSGAAEEGAKYRKGGMIRLETLTELKFIDSSFSSFCRREPKGFLLKVGLHFYVFPLINFNDL